MAVIMKPGKTGLTGSVERNSIETSETGVGVETNFVVNSISPFQDDARSCNKLTVPKTVFAQ